MQNLRKENVRVVKSEWKGPRRLKKAPKRRVKSKSATKSRTKLKSLSKLKKELDSVFSQYQRIRFADKDGMVRCYTNPNVKMHWTKAHNGHYITRGCLNLRWHLDNSRPQSPGENIWKHGNPIQFRENLVKELGEGGVRYLEEARHVLFKPKREFYEFQIKSYSDKLASLHAES